MNISKASEITVQDVADYIRLDDPDEGELGELTTFLSAAQAFVKAYTGQTDLDAHDDFVLAVLILCQDMYDNRTMYVDTQNLNFAVKSILDLHSVNLL
ncbi:MAG: phage gp6-like head-tail connector protein [Oscillospiraceae bacterium]|nr:phage gp6-like head-tail connector protein [Oscillospiraceae bacterium]